MLNVVDMDKVEETNSKSVIWLKKSDPQSGGSNQSAIRHYMINLVGRGFVLNFIKDKALPLWKKIWAVILLLLYVIFRVDYFVKFLRREIDQNGLLNLYKQIVDYSGIPLRCALQVLNDPENIPFIVCCHAGKDRTGILSAILLSICGYDKNTISNDFALSEVGLPISHKELETYSESMRHAPYNLMYQLLEYIDEKYGSIAEYLVYIGFSLEEQQNLRKRLTGVKF